MRYLKNARSDFGPFFSSCLSPAALIKYVKTGKSTFTPPPPLALTTPIPFIKNRVNKILYEIQKKGDTATIAYGQNHVSNSLMCDSLQIAVIYISILFKLKHLNIKPS